MEMNERIQWMDVSLYQMEVYVNDHVQIWHVVQITKTPEPARDHDRNKSGSLRGRLVFCDITLNPDPKYISKKGTHSGKKETLKCFSFAS